MKEQSIDSLIEELLGGAKVEAPVETSVTKEASEPTTRNTVPKVTTNGITVVYDTPESQSQNADPKEEVAPKAKKKRKKTVIIIAVVALLVTSFVVDLWDYYSKAYVWNDDILSDFECAENPSTGEKIFYNKERSQVYRERLVLVDSRNNAIMDSYEPVIYLGSQDEYMAFVFVDEDAMSKKKNDEKAWFMVIYPEKKEYASELIYVDKFDWSSEGTLHFVNTEGEDKVYANLKDFFEQEHYDYMNYGYTLFDRWRW